MRKSQILLYGGASIAAIVAFMVLSPVTWVDAGEVDVIQSPVDGTLKVVTEPGPTWNGMGSVKPYARRRQLIFECPGVKREVKTGACLSKDPDTSIQVRYNDGGHAWVSGIVSWEMPLGAPAVVRLHKEFGSDEAIDRQLVLPAIVKAFYLTSPLMSSTESYASRRTEFLQLFEDQLRNGVYKTRTVQVKEKDPISGEERTVSKVELIMDDKGVPVRAEDSAFKIYGISILPATITHLDYDPEVETQIGKQRDAVLSVQEAQANAKKAEQDAITAQKNGEAKSAVARAEQEAIKATEVTQAEKQRDVAKLQQEAAVFTKQRDILLGEGEAERKRLTMNADGALQQKIDAFVKINGFYADAFKNHQGALVPSVVMGGNGNGQTAGSGAQAFMDLFAAKTAHDLSLDLSLPSQKK